MRKYSSAAAVMVLAVCVSNSQWESQNSTVGAMLWDICFVDSLYGWAVGDSATIVATTDGGGTWERTFGPIDSVEFKQVQFLDRWRGFVAGNVIRRFPFYTALLVILLQTTDGGATWARRDSMPAADLTFGDIQFLDSTHGFLAVNNIGQVIFGERKGILLETHDAGKTWSILQQKNILLIGAVAYLDSSIGYSFWSPSVDNYDNTDVYRTQNGGADWTPAGTISQEIVKRAVCITPGTIWTIGFKTSRSTNGGQSWQSWNWFSPLPAGQKHFIPADLEIIDSDNVWVAGGAFTSANDIEGDLIRTTNAGVDWGSDLQAAYYSFHGLAVTSGKAWISGRNGLIIHMKRVVSGTGSEPSHPPASLDLHQNYPNPFNASTIIEYNLDTSGEVKLDVFDILGRRIRRLQASKEGAGHHRVSWDGMNDSAMPAPSGVYVYRLMSNGVISSKKMVLVH